MRLPAVVMLLAAATPVVADDEPEVGSTEVIHVHGSTVERELFAGRAPVSILTRDDLLASGRSTLGEILQALPAQSNAANAQVNAGGDGTTRINLRGLGAPRTLVLLNGRRIVNGGNGADAAVDIDAIPLAMIERVEIYKDGASAIYGADAVGGVVNLVTRPQFDGTEVSLLTGTSPRGDGTEYDASFVTGYTTKDGQSYLVLSGGYQNHVAVLAGNRAFSAFQDSYDFTTHTPRHTVSLAGPSGRLDATSIGAGGIRPPGCASDACKPDGAGGWTDFGVPGDLYNEAATSYLYTPSTRYSVLATAGNKITPHLSSFFELLYQRRSSDRELSPVAFVADSRISKDSLYNSLGGDILDYRRRMTELGPRQYFDQVNTLRFVAGLAGHVSNDAERFAGWSWELSANYGNTDSLLRTSGQLYKPHVADALGPSMLDANGVPICVRVPGDPATKIVYTVHKADGRIERIPCVPLNLMVPAGAIPRDQLEHLTFDDQGGGNDGMRTLLATAGGRVTALPHHGEIALSLGGEYRDELGSQESPSVASGGDSTETAAKDTEGESRIASGFGDLVIVPIADHAVVRRLEIDLGARALHHTQAGSHVTYKAGGLLRTAWGVAVRGTRATTFRAPSIRELLGGRVERTINAEDPCDAHPPSVGDGTKTLDATVQAQCSAQGVPSGIALTTNQQVSATSGNLDLRAETAATTTLGVVYEPPSIPDLALSADYWHIRIDNAIETLGVATIFANCYDRAEDAFCDQIHRDPTTHRIVSVDQPLQNLHRVTTSGFDLALSYVARLGELGRIHTGLEAQYLLRYDLDTGHQRVRGAGVYDLGVYPHYRASLTSRWAHPHGGSAGFSLRFVGAYRECADDDCNTGDHLAARSREVPRYFKLDVFGAYDFQSGAGKATLQLGVNNVLDAAPPLVYTAAAANSDASAYDFIGRMIYVRLSHLF